MLEPGDAMLPKSNALRLCHLDSSSLLAVSMALQTIFHMIYWFRLAESALPCLHVAD